jgi:hypothetical protein
VSGWNFGRSSSPRHEFALLYKGRGPRAPCCEPVVKVGFGSRGGDGRQTSGWNPNRQQAFNFVTSKPVTLRNGINKHFLFIQGLQSSVADRVSEVREFCFISPFSDQITKPSFRESFIGPSAFYFR